MSKPRLFLGEYVRFMTVALDFPLEGRIESIHKEEEDLWFYVVKLDDGTQFYQNMGDVSYVQILKRNEKLTKPKATVKNYGKLRLVK